MDKPELLLTRLDEIGASLAASGRAQALIALGSAGKQRARLDAYSDLDFFAIVEPGSKQAFLDDLGWLSSICPIAYSYRNTPDGHKLLFEDGVFCEFAVFEMHELSRIPFAPGSVIWKQADVTDAQLLPNPLWLTPPVHSVEWLLGEALSNLFSGLCRHARGEKLAAMRAIQVYAVDRVLELGALLEQETDAERDVFAFERRYERRFPAGTQSLPHFVQGYEHNVESALAILAFLDLHFKVAPAMKRAIMELSKHAAGGM
ncbi:MAG: hypothetical protein KJ795_11475 [Gammaproteobacteria bacterium]|nr:hypothetical protein [Gammaproteobacteria bacterium]MBU1775241.1 hypothetical protein [Gammaproteobacteria bacterium]MBU1968640.1 hypothetical protein [Gammaproteobacteria bacterium]